MMVPYHDRPLFYAMLNRVAGYAIKDLGLTEWWGMQRILPENDIKSAKPVGAHLVERIVNKISTSINMTMTDEYMMLNIGLLH